MSVVVIKFKKFSESAKIPVYARQGDAGMDVVTTISEPLEVLPGQWKLLPTGLGADIPVGYEIQVRPRSGLAAKHGLTVLNTPGTVDCGYKDEIKVILINLSDTPYTVYPGDRIAQFVVSELPNKVIIEETGKLSQDNNRGGGFGHTGK